MASAKDSVDKMLKHFETSTQPNSIDDVYDKQTDDFVRLEVKTNNSVFVGAVLYAIRMQN